MRKVPGGQDLEALSLEPTLADRFTKTRTGCSTPLMPCRIWNGFLLANETPAYASGACRHGHGQPVQMLCRRRGYSWM